MFPRIRLGSFRPRMWQALALSLVIPVIAASALVAWAAATVIDMEGLNSGIPIHGQSEEGGTWSASGAATGSCVTYDHEFSPI